MPSDPKPMNRLRRMLEPDERIVFQTRRRSLVAYWRSKLADWSGTTLFGPGILIPFSGAPADHFSEIYLMSAGFIALAYPAWLAFVTLSLLLRPDQVALTDRRLLYAAGGPFGWTTLSMDLADIARVEGSVTAGQTTIRMPGKARDFLIPRLAEPKPFLVALKKSIRSRKLEQAPWPGKRDAEKIGFLAAWAAIMMGGFMAISALGLVDMVAAPGSGLVILIPLALVSMIGGFAIGPSIAYLTALAVARPFTSQARMRQIAETTNWIPNWSGPLVQKWVSLLYREPVSPNSA